MPFKGKTNINFPEGNSNRNVLVIFGDNMTGKTSIMNAIRWCFYGRALNRNMKSYPLASIVNKSAAADDEWIVEVAIRFSTENGKYEIVRKAKKNNKAPVPRSDLDFNLSLLMKKDGEAIPGGEIEATLNRIIPEVTSRFFLFDGELLQEYENLLIEGDERGEAIKDAIERVLGVPAITNGRDELQTILARANRAFRKENEQDERIKKQEKRMTFLEESISTAKNDVAEFDLIINQCKAEISEISTELDNIESLYQRKAELDAARASLKSIEDSIEELLVQRLTLRRDLWRDLLQPVVEKKLGYLRGEYESNSQLKNEMYKFKVVLNQRKEILANETCPTCSQKISSSLRDEIKKQVDNATIGPDGVDETKIDEEQSRLFAEIQLLDGIATKNSANSYSWVENELSKAEIAKTARENKIASLETQLQGADIDEVSRKRLKYKNLLNQEGRTQQEKSDRQKELVDMRDEYNVLSKAIIEMTSGTSTILRKKVELCSVLYDVFEKSIVILRNDLKSRVESYSTEAFNVMSTQPFYKGLKINNNYGLNIIDQNDNVVSIRSAGAEQIVALSLIVGLSRISVSEGPIIMDTPFGRLDRKHRAAVIDYFPTVANQLVLLVHDGEINKAEDLANIRSQISSAFEINEVAPNHHELSKVVL